MKDPELEAYCNQIESYFFQWKAHPGFLSPEDFTRVQSWYENGVPVETVLEGISDAFLANQESRNAGVEDVNSLGFCEPFVESALKRRKSS
jgi:hypothetical protein